MSSLMEINPFNRTILIALIFASIFMLVILIMNHYQGKRSVLYILVDIALLSVSYLEFNILVMAMFKAIDGGLVTGWRVDYIKKPALIYMVVAIAVLSVVVYLYIRDYKWRKEHLSLNSIKESIDSMPYGMCCYYEEGMPRLINNNMNKLSMDIFGESISNAAQFWSRLKNESETESAKRIILKDLPTWIINDSQVWSFSREKINYEKGYLYEIIATNITKEYEKTAQLEADNKRMKEVTKKLKEYSQNVTRLTVEKEILDAKVRIHSELGQTLVVTRRYLLIGDMDEKKLLEMWNKNIKLLKKESLNIANDDYKILDINAEQLGIELTIPERLPEEEKVKNIIISAVDECITNTYKYTKSRKLVVEVAEIDDIYQICISNPADVPEANISEKGGLGNLRRRVEGQGGSMETSTRPCFTLKISVGKE